MPSAALIQKLKRTYAGGLVEINIWRVAGGVPPCEHPYKYRLAYVVAGRRVIGFDNERGMGDHQHGPEGEQPYAFVSLEQLLADFWEAVDGYGGTSAYWHKYTIDDIVLGTGGIDAQDCSHSALLG
jgi:hypothetical protein